MSDTNFDRRRLPLTILTAILIVTAGCTNGVGGDSPGSDASEPNTETPETFITPASGDDLRSASFDIPFGLSKEDGELDADDPRRNNRAYEPIQFVGKEGRSYNITMDSEVGAKAKLRLIDPDGKVVAVATEEGATPAKFSLIELNKTGNYTVEATSAEPRSGFEYTLTINEVLFAGPVPEYTEFEKYILFATNVENSWNRDHLASNATHYTSSTNTKDDYIVVEYERPVDADDTQQNTDWSVMARSVADAYNAQFDPYDRENPQEWLPDRVYFNGYTKGGELVQTNYVSLRWTKEFTASGKSDEDVQRYFYRTTGTTKYGPTHNAYDDVEAKHHVVEDTFPYPTYNESYNDFPTADS